MPGTGNTSIRSWNFFADATIAGAGAYTDTPLLFIDDDSGIQFTSHTIQLVNDGGSDIFFRVVDPALGAADHGRIKAGESLTQDFRRLKNIWLRGTPGTAFRFWAW